MNYSISSDNHKGIIADLLVNNLPFHLSNGDCIVIPKFATVVGQQSTSSSFIMDWMHFLCPGIKTNKQDKQFQSGIREYLNDGFSSSINHLAFLPTQFKINQQSYIFQLVRQLTLLSNEKRYSDRPRDFLVGLIISELSNDYLTGLVTSGKNDPSNVLFIAEWIRVHLSEDLTVSLISEHFQMNPTYLTRKFHNSFGMSIKTYILEQKIIQAKYLLSTSIDSIVDISEKSFFPVPKTLCEPLKSTLVLHLPKTGTFILEHI